MKLTRPIIILIFLAISLILGFIAFIAYLDEYQMKQQGQNLVDRVEKFREENKRLPDSLSELGAKDDESSQPFYEKRGDADYVIYYNIGFDDVLVYYSSLKMWENFYQK